MPASPVENSNGPVGLIVKVNGAEFLSITQVMTVEVTKEIGAVPMARVSVIVNEIIANAAPDYNGDNVRLGDQISLAAYYGDGEEQTLFEGLVAALRLRTDSQRRLRLDLTCRDEAAKLLELRRSALYEQMKDSDVMSRIIRDAGLTADVETSGGAVVTQLRHAASDWEFLRILADRNGFVLIADDGKISARAPATDAEAPLGVTFGVDLIDLDVTIDAQRAISAAEIAAWNPQDQNAVSGRSGALPAMTLGDATSTAIAGVLGDRERLASTPAEIGEADLGRLADARAARSVLGAVHGRCRFQGSGRIAPGDMLQIDGAGAMFSNKAYVSGVHHRISGGSWITEAILGLPADWAVDRSGPVTAEITAPHLGLQIGKVLTVADDPDGKMRIKVSLPMIGNPPAEVWARYGQPYATSGAGIQFMPEVDDEVVIGFLGADPNAPIVLGSLHSGANAQALAPGAENKVKGIITREKLRIDFDDDKKILTLTTPGGHSISMDDDAKELKLKDMNGNSVTFSSSGIAIDSDKDVTLTAGGKIDVTATQDATVKGMNVTCQGNAGFTGKGGATAELSAGGQTTVKGALVMIN
ncbi:MAG: phage baseplate assembly protein V [Paracoccus sp. (in: a-proteobacteria)]